MKGPDAVISWYDEHARDLPWRRPGTTPWGVLVSEVMLQQTPVARVEPAYELWLRRWPTPAALAADTPAAAIRAWGRLGYPRRALRLHAAARVCVEQYAGDLPHDVRELRSLPGVGEYTAAAVATFAFGERQPVLDTNVRRVHARVFDGVEFPPGPNITVAQRQRAAAALPDDAATAARFSIAVMELGALVCTARSPACQACPLRPDCAWFAAGRPPWQGPPRHGQSYAGTDRQCRGSLLAVLRSASGPVPERALEAAWQDQTQRLRALDGLVADGLVEPLNGSRYALPS